MKNSVVKHFFTTEFSTCKIFLQVEKGLSVLIFTLDMKGEKSE
nr:MAG TPA: hypothetical protein [Caudoviricetes sp.]